MKFIYNDGGRALAGFKGSAGDCVARAIAIVSDRPYINVYGELAIVNASTRGRSSASGKKSARNGMPTKSVLFKRYMQRMGWKWTPTMFIGSGCKVHLTDDELPMGRLVVAVSKHYTAVIDRVIHDTHDPQREAHCMEQDLTGIKELKPGQWRRGNTICSIQRRCVYGYWSMEAV